ncbi:MAG: hypothetical protein PHY64_08370 [Eubacteriales bacterium]|nr:hypothetical protein [Eubacteriales bacterium]
MKFLKTEFGKIHTLIAVFVLATLTLGAGMAFRLIPYIPYGEIHGFLGASIIPLWILLPMLSPRRKNLYRILRERVMMNRRDLQKGRPLGIAAKVVTMAMVLLFLLQLSTGALMETGLTYTLFPSFSMLTFHTGFLYALLTLVALHACLMFLVKHSRGQKK